MFHFVGQQTFSIMLTRIYLLFPCLDVKCLFKLTMCSSLMHQPAQGAMRYLRHML